MKALGEIFPVCKSLVGDAFFEAMAESYIKSHRPTKDRLDDYGESFSLFLPTFAPVQSLPYLPDMATLEWQVHQVFHAKDVAPDNNAVVLQKMESGEVDPLSISLVNIPGLAVLSLAYPVQKLLEMYWLDDWQEVAMDLEDTQLLLWRNGVNIHSQVLTEEAYRWHSQLNKPLALWSLQENFEGFNDLFATGLQQGSIEMLATS